MLCDHLQMPFMQFFPHKWFEFKLILATRAAVPNGIESSQIATFFPRFGASVLFCLTPTGTLAFSISWACLFGWLIMMATIITSLDWNFRLASIHYIKSQIYITCECHSKYSASFSEPLCAPITKLHCRSTKYSDYVILEAHGKFKSLNSIFITSCLADWLTDWLASNKRQLFSSKQPLINSVRVYTKADEIKSPTNDYRDSDDSFRVFFVSLVSDLLLVDMKIEFYCIISHRVWTF